jgi:hypothetical protein
MTGRADSRKTFTKHALWMALLLLVGSSPSVSQEPPLAGDIEAPAVSNAPEKSPEKSRRDLIKRLLDDKTRLAAFRELAKGSDDDESWRRTSAEVIVCPQGEGKDPIYMVLTPFSYGSYSYAGRHAGYPVADPGGLFGPPPERPIPPHAKFDKRDNLIIYAFTAEGQSVMPFHGDNMLDQGLIADINGDGLVERADHVGYHVDKVKCVQVLHVRVVRETPQPAILSVLYNWGDKADWDYQFVDRDNDGIAEVEFGPRADGGAVKPKAVFTWDKQKHTYVGPQGKAGDHFLCLSPENQQGNGEFDVFKQLKEKGVVFPADPDALDVGHVGHIVTVARRRSLPEERPLPPPARPYQYASLRNLSNPEIASYMGEGKAAYQFAWQFLVKTQAPGDFWTLPPKAVSLAMAEANRTAEHREAYRLAVDARDGKQPPKTCSVYYSFRSRRCYFTEDSKFFLRVDPAGSYLALTSQQGLGVVYDDIVEAHPLYDVRFIDLTYEEARQFAGVLWWLNRVRSWTENYGSNRFISSTGDGSGALRMSTGDSEEILVQDTVWANHVSQRWEGDYGPDTFLNLADYLFRAVLPKHLGERWTRQQPLPDDVAMTSSAYRGGREKPLEPKPSDEEGKKRLQQAREQVGRLTGLFTADGSRLPHALLLDVIQEAGDFALADFLPQLQSMEKALPPPDRPVRTREVVERQWRKVMDSHKIGDDSDDSTKLFEELKVLEHGLSPEAAEEELRQAVGLALAKIAAADDPPALQPWAQSENEGWQWALQRLRLTDKKRYVQALEWLLHETGGKWTRQVFGAIAEADPERAEVLAQQVAPDQKDDLAVSAFSVLEKAKAVEDRDKRIDALIAVALDPKSDWEERGKAIECLVPDDDPLRYPDRKIDEAMARLFDPKLKDDLINFTAARACYALAMRGRLEYFEPMAQLLETEKDGMVHERILDALTSLALSGRAEQRSQMLAVLGRQLKDRDRDPSKAILSIYALDLRELKGDVAALGTASPEDYEGGKVRLAADGALSVRPRYHMARKIAAIWNEEDPATRGRLLAAFYFNHGGSCKSATRTARRQLQNLAKTLRSDAAQQVAAFASWYEREFLKSDTGTEERERAAEFAKFIRSTFGAESERPE